MITWNEDDYDTITGQYYSTLINSFFDWIKEKRIMVRVHKSFDSLGAINNASLELYGPSSYSLEIYFQI